MILPTHGDGTPLGTSAIDPARTRLTILHREFNLDHLICSTIDSGCPARTHTSVWTNGLLLLPIDLEVAGVEAFSRLGLPSVISARGAEQLHTVITLARHQQFSVQIAGVDDV